MKSNLWEKTYWTAPIEYITSTYIREYDISKANINVLLKMGAIDMNLYDYLYRLPKYAREVMVGHYLRDNKLGKALVEGVREQRRLFFEANDIQDYNVLSIKNDAIYLIEMIPKITEFDGVSFVKKSTYTSYYKLDRKYNKEMYYTLDLPNEIEILDIKGLGPKAYSLHKDHMIDFLKVLFSTVELNPISDSIELIQKFSESYLNKELPIEYYRRFDSICGYDTVARDTLGNMYNINYLSQNDIGIVEIGYNYGIIMNLYRYIASMNFKKK